MAHVSKSPHKPVIFPTLCGHFLARNGSAGETPFSRFASNFSLKAGRFFNAIDYCLQREVCCSLHPRISFCVRGIACRSCTPFDEVEIYFFYFLYVRVMCICLCMQRVEALLKLLLLLLLLLFLVVTRLLHVKGVVDKVQVGVHEVTQQDLLAQLPLRVA